MIVSLFVSKSHLNSLLFLFLLSLLNIDSCTLDRPALKPNPDNCVAHDIIAVAVAFRFECQGNQKKSKAKCSTTCKKYEGVTGMFCVKYKDRCEHT